MSARTKLLFREAWQQGAHLLGMRRVASALPTEAAVFLTRRCNSQCSMCDYWKQPRSQNELSLAQTCNLLDQLKELGVIVLSLSGEGEITLRQDLPEIIADAAKKNFLFSINSNLLNLPENVADAIAKYKPYQVTVGIDTLDEAKYKQIRGIAGGVGRIEKSIQKLLERGYRNVALGAIVLDRNLADLPGLAEYAKQHGLAGVRYTAFQPSGFSKEWNPEDLKEYRSAEYQRKLLLTIQQLIDMKGNGYPILNSKPYLKMIAQSYRTNCFFPVPCVSTWRRIHINSLGEVFLCQVREDKSKIGNLDEAPLRRLWHNEKALQFRDLADQQKCGGCWLSCYGETNLRFRPKYMWETLQNSLTRYRRIQGPSL